MVDAVVTIPGAEPFSAAGSGQRARTGVVVLHGFTGNPNSTKPLGRSLAARGHRVEVPCLPGHGTDVRDLARTRYADWFGAVERVVRQVREGTDHLVVVGLSMGGTLTLDVASRHPDLVDGAVVINPQISDPTQPLAKLAPVLQHVLPFVPRDLAGLPSDDIARPSADERAYPMVSAKAAQSLIVELPRIRSQLPRLTQPLLVAWSPRDHSVPPANAESLPGLVGSDDVERLVLHRSYHVATLDYDQPRLEAAVAAFVDRVGGTG
ncbi:alpha/beta fold hydrolase [Nitriliruptoraceae bacterium ZYF776]|nr:alpha/beta fold hydrolase [Profundirhabdus halotolerans]